MTETAASTGPSAILPLAFEDAKKIVQDALMQEQFGVVSEVDLQSKFKEKLGIDHPKHVILGACNPHIAYKASRDNPDVALALPCNVVLREITADQTEVSAISPLIALQPFEGADVRHAAGEAAIKINRVFATLTRH